MSYRGQVVELPLGVDGLTGTKNLSNVRPGQLLRATNITYENGTLQKEGGTSKYNSTVIGGAPSVIGGWDWHPTIGTQRMVVMTSDGDLLKDTGGGDFTVTLDTGLTASDVVPVFVDGGQEALANDRKLFVFTGKNAVQVLAADGATTADISTPPADWSGATQPKTGVIHEGRLWGFLRNRAYYSLATNHEDFTTADAGDLAIFPGESEEIIGAQSFRGLLVVWKKPTGVYLIDTSSPTLSEWRVTRMSSSTGLASPLAAIQVDSDVLFVDQNVNFHLLSGVDEFGDITSRNLSQISDMGPFLRENINLNMTGNMRGIYYPAKREAHFATAGAGSTTNTRRIVVDFNRLDKPRFRFSTRDTAESLWLRKDSDGIPRPVYGDDAGFVRDMDKSSRSHDGAGYNGEWQTPHSDFSELDPKLGTRRKNGQFLEAVIEPTGNFNLSVDILWDGVVTQTVTFNLGESGSSLGSFVLDTDVLAGDSVLNKKARITGSGRRFSIIGRNNGDGQDFSNARMYLHFKVGGGRL